MLKCKLMAAAAALALLASAAFTPVPAKADWLDASKNWLGNVVFGWTDCFKGAVDEIGKAKSRAYVGVLVTAPISCGTNVAVRYVGNAADIVSIPVAGKNVVNPATLGSWDPPVKF